MTQKQITLPQCELLVVELPEGASEIRIFNDLHRPYISYRLRHETGRVYFPVDGNWQHLGAVNDVSEGQIREFLPKSKNGKGFRDYNNPFECYPYSPLESLHSLLTANGVVFENPLGRERPKLKLEDSDYDEFGFVVGDGIKKGAVWEDQYWNWLEAQEQVWDINRTHLFIKQK